MGKRKFFRPRIYLPSRIPLSEADWTRITPGQAAFIREYLQCQDLQEACKRAGVSYNTYKTHWVQDDNFRACFEIAQRRLLDSLQELAVLEAPRVYERIRQLAFQDDDKRVALNAAKALLAMAEDPTLTGTRRAAFSASAAWAKALAQLAPLMAETAGVEVLAEDVVEGEVSALPEPEMEDDSVLQEEMDELTAKAKYLYVYETEDS